MEAAQGSWVDEFPSVLWAMRTTEHEPRGASSDCFMEQRQLSLERLPVHHIERAIKEKFTRTRKEEMTNT